jgi:hypothetical protein
VVVVMMIRAGVRGCRVFDCGMFAGHCIGGMQGVRARGAVPCQRGVATGETRAMRTGRRTATAQSETCAKMSAATSEAATMSAATAAVSTATATVSTATAAAAATATATARGCSAAAAAAAGASSARRKNRTRKD